MIWKEYLNFLKVNKINKCPDCNFELEMIHLDENDQAEYWYLDPLRLGCIDCGWWE